MVDPGDEPRQIFKDRSTRSRFGLNRLKRPFQAEVRLKRTVMQVTRDLSSLEQDRTNVIHRHQPRQHHQKWR